MPVKNQVFFPAQQLGYFLIQMFEGFGKYLHNSKRPVQWPSGSLGLPCFGKKADAELCDWNVMTTHERHNLGQALTICCYDSAALPPAAAAYMQMWACVCGHLRPSLTHLNEIIGAGHQGFVSLRELPSTDGSCRGSDGSICSPKQSCRHQPAGPLTPEPH